MKRLCGVGLLALAMAGCATTPRYQGPTQDELAARDASQYVDQRMAAAVTSIDKSLQTLIILERGTEAPRLPTPLGDTVAGAAGPKTTPAKPASPRATPAGKPTPAVDASELDVRLEITWNGPWEGLLREVASALRFRYVEKNKGTLGQGTWSTTGASARQVLEAVANQVKGKAEIRVILSEKTIEVVYP